MSSYKNRTFKIRPYVPHTRLQIEIQFFTMVIFMATKQLRALYPLNTVQV